MERVILHSDMNNFYASVECLFQPELRGKAMAVAGDQEARHGIVLAKSEEAKRCGVKTAEPLWQAKQKCPHIIFVPPHHERYAAYSRRARTIYARFTDQVEPFGLDEAWLDVSASQKLFGTGPEIAEAVRAAIKAELGLTVSVGLSFNKVFAKLASDTAPPDRVALITRENYRQTLWPLPIRSLLFVGKATEAKLAAYRIYTIGELARADEQMLARLLGKHGRMLWQYANGLDNEPVKRLDDKTLPKSISNSTTTPHDLVDEAEVRLTLHLLCESVSSRLRQLGLVCRTVRLGLRDANLRWQEKQEPLPVPNRTAEALFRACLGMYRRHALYGKPLRSISVCAADLLLPQYQQLSLFDERQQVEKQENLEQTLDKLRDRFGAGAVRRGIMLTDETLAGVEPKGNSE